MGLSNLAAVAQTHSMNDSDALLVEQGGSLKRISKKEFLSNAADGLALPTYTLEQSSSSTFDVIKKSMAVEIYRANMGGYGLKMKNGKAYKAKLNNDWSAFLDGTSAMDTSKFETMIELPPCHFKASGKTMQFGGMTPIDGGKTFGAPRFVGAYKMYVDASGIGHSRADVAPSHSRSMSDFWNCAQKLGAQWGLANYQFHCLINALYQVSYGNLNSQSVIGAGFQHSSWEKCRDVVMGKTRSLGDGSGSVLYNDADLGNQYPVKLFGFEDLWGKLWELRPGVRFYMDGDTRYAVVYDGNQVSNTANGRKFAYALTTANGENASKMQLGDNWDMLPIATGGGSSDNYCDGAWASTGGQLLVVGGLAGYGSRCGVSYASSNYGFGYSWSAFSARLAFYGEAELVSGKELMTM